MTRGRTIRPIGRDGRKKARRETSEPTGREGGKRTRGKAGGPSLSVVIPTRNRREQLGSTLTSVLADAGRPGAPGIEIIVVDDGSTDGTAEWLDRRPFDRAVSHVRLGYHGGPAAARNEGARRARAARILFLADDLRVALGFLAAHHSAHGGTARTSDMRAVVGEIRWDRDLKVTPFMRFLEEEGIHFDYGAIRREAAAGEIPFWRAYTSNLSIGRNDFLAIGGFDQSFPEAAYEDMEFAYRFTQRGGTLAFEPRALAWHTSRSTIRSYLAWRRRASPSALAASAKAPPLAAKVLRPALGHLRPARWLYANPFVAGSLALVASYLDASLSLPLPRALYRGLLSYATPRAPGPDSAAAGISLRPGWRAGASLIPARLLHERLASIAPAVRGDVLDLGCGEAPYRSFFDPGSIRLYAGVDIRAVPGSALPTAVANASRLPFRSASFDAVLAIELLEHCPDPGAVVAEAHRVLRPGGTFVVSAPFFYPPHDLPHDYFRFTADGLARLIQGAGLALRSIEPVGGAGSVVADLAIKMLNETALAGGSALARMVRLGPGATRGWNRAVGGVLARLSGLAGAAFLATRSCLAAWIAHKPSGWLRSRIHRFLADRSSRIAKGYLGVAVKTRDGTG